MFVFEGCESIVFFVVSWVGGSIPCVGFLITRDPRLGSVSSTAAFLAELSIFQVLLKSASDFIFFGEGY